MKSLLAVGMLFLAVAGSAMPARVRPDTTFAKKNATELGSQQSAVDAICSVFCGSVSAAGVAGIVGNAEQESSLNPTIKQYGGGPGRGLFQMSVGGLWAVNQEYCSENGCDVWSAEGQASFVKATIFDQKWADKAYGWGTAQQLQSELQTSSVSSAATSFMSNWERCGDCDTSNRINYANQWYSYVQQKCGGGGGGGGGGGSGCCACIKGNGGAACASRCGSKSASCQTCVQYKGGMACGAKCGCN